MIMIVIVNYSVQMIYNTNGRGKGVELVIWFVLMFEGVDVIVVFGFFVKLLDEFDELIFGYR